MIPRQEGSKFGDQGDEPGDKVQGLEGDMRGPVPVRCLQRTPDVRALGQCEPLGRDRRPADIPRQMLGPVAIRYVIE